MFDEIPEHLLVRELISRRGLHEFARQFWHLVEPRQFVDNWHYGAISEAYTAVFEGQIKRLVTNVPPGMGKSLFTNVFFPAYVWSRDPGFKMLAGSFDLSLLLRDSQKLYDLMSSDLYRECYPASGIVKGCALSSLQLEGKGLQLSIAVGGRGTGWHGDLVRVDDPVKPLQARSKSGSANKRSINWYQGTLANRRVDPASFRFMLTMQRLSKGDLSEYLLDQGFEHLCLPMHYEPKAIWIRGGLSEKLDPRKTRGELLFPARFDETTVKDLEKGLGTPGNVSAQNEQNPTPDKGGIVEQKWFRYYNLREISDALSYVQFWDLNFKGSEESHSMVCGSLFAFGDGYLRLVAECRGLWNYPQARDEYVRAQTLPMWKRTSVIFIEDKANGPALCADVADHNNKFGTQIPEPQELPPAPGDKIFRLGSRSTMIQGGKFLIPLPDTEHPENTNWIYEPTDGWLAEVVGFPNALKNDRVDTLSAFLNWISGPMAAALRWAHND